MEKNFSYQILLICYFPTWEKIGGEYLSVNEFNFKFDWSTVSTRTYLM